MDARLCLPADMNIEADAQLYALIWRSRLDRRNAEFSCYASVDALSRFVFGMHANFDGRVDPFEVNAQAARTGEVDLPEPHRHLSPWRRVGPIDAMPRQASLRYRILTGGVALVRHLLKQHGNELE